MTPVETGKTASGYEWRNMTIVLDIQGYQGAITKQIFRVNGDRVDDVLAWKVGDKVQVGFTLYAREWKDKWYNNVDLVTITSPEGAVKEKADAPVQEVETEIQVEREDLPF